MQVWTVLHAARCKDTKQKLCKKSRNPAHHHTTLLGYIFTTTACIDNRKKNLLKSSIFSTYPQNIVNVDPLTAEIRWRVWATLGHFSGFRILASSLHRRRAMQVNQTLHNVWPSPRLVHYIYTCPLKEFCQVQNLLCVQVLRYPILAALLYGTRAVGISPTLQRVIFTWQGGHAIQHWAVKLSSSIINKLT